MEKLFELTFQDQTLNPQVGTFTDASQATGTFTLEDGEYYLTNGDTKGFYAYAPIAIQPDSGTDNKVTVEFDLKVVTASANTHTIIGTYAGVDGSGIPTGAKIMLQYTAGDIELVLGSGTTATLIESADVVVDQWYHFRIDCALDALVESTYQVKIDGVSITTVTGGTTDYELGIIGVLGTDLHACDECGIKNIRIITDDDYFVGRTALNQALKDTKGYVDTHCVDLTSAQTIGGNKTFSGNTKFAASATIEKSGGDVELLIKNTAVDATSVSANMLDDIRFTDSNNKITGAMRIAYDTSNGVTVMMYARSYSADGNTSAVAGLSITSNQQTGAARATISANLLPNNTNTYDLGSSAAPWNNAYAKTVVTGGITLDNKAIDTDANGNMTFNGNKVLTNANLTFSYNAQTETLTVTY